jgi:predicted Zn-dependent protease with MMP-like domain
MPLENNDKRFLFQLNPCSHSPYVTFSLTRGWRLTLFLLNNMTYYVRTSQETHYVSTTEPNRLMLFRETVAVYCENHTEHTDTVRTSQETYYVSATEPNRLMLFRETVAVYCENHTEHTDTVRTSQETVAVYCENHTEHTDIVRGHNADF